MRRLRRRLAILWDAVLSFNRNDGWAMAGYIAFSCILSLFPFLIAAATLIGIAVGQERSGEIIDAIFNIVPAHVALTIEPVVIEVLSKSSGRVLTASTLFAIWVASSAVESFRVAFDRAYRVDDPRGIIHNRLLAIGLVFLGSITAALLGVSILFAGPILAFVEQFAPLPPGAYSITYGFGVIVLVSFLFIMHRVLPGRSMKGTQTWPGVLVTTILWITAATVFTTYLSFTPAYTITYGTLAGVMITLMFFYITGLTIIYGAELNASLDDRVRSENARMAAGQRLGIPWR